MDLSCACMGYARVLHNTIIVWTIVLWWFSLLPFPQVHDVYHKYFKKLLRAKLWDVVCVHNYIILLLCTWSFTVHDNSSLSSSPSLLCVVHLTRVQQGRPGTEGSVFHCTVSCSSCQRCTCHCTCWFVWQSLVVMLEYMHHAGSCI